MKETLKVYVVSLGCPKNRVDSEEMLGSLPGQPIAVETPEEAELIIVNTCGFIAPAIEESVRVILEMAEAVRDIKPKPKLAVTGCLVSRFGSELAADLPEVDLFLSTRELGLWPQRIAALLGRKARSGPRALTTPPGYAYLKISEGCGHSCRFCAIPSIRGPLQSREPARVIDEAAQLLKRGVGELILVAQDLTSYAQDLGEKQGLVKLLDKLVKLEGLKWLRLMYLYPAGLSREFLKYLSELGPPLLSYFDIPLQHAHPEILKSMGRPFARDPFEVIGRVREFFPQAIIRSSLIVGYPGETKAHYQVLRDFVRQARLNHLGVFTFHPEEGTSAALLPGQVDSRTKAARRREIMRLQAGISSEFLAARVGEELEIMVDEPSPEWPGLYLGRAWFQAPEVDGLTYVSGPGCAPGKLVRAVISEAKTYDLVALEE